MGHGIPNLSKYDQLASCLFFSKVHPYEPMFAVAEKGDNPPILFYSWPDLEVKKVLRDGAASEFNSITFR